MGARARNPRKVEQAIWRMMIYRCHKQHHPFFPNYGGRGITVCQRWRESFDSFYADLGARPSSAHSIERVNNEGNYEPSNCKWATRAEQNANTRKNVRIMIDGETKTLAAWSRLSGVTAQTISKRLRSGIPPKTAVFLKIGKGQRLRTSCRAVQ